MSDSLNHRPHFLALSSRVDTVQIRLGRNTIGLICVFPQIHRAISSAENPSLTNTFSPPLRAAAINPLTPGYSARALDGGAACFESSNHPWKSILEGREMNLIIRALKGTSSSFPPPNLHRIDRQNIIQFSCCSFTLISYKPPYSEQS